MTVSRLTSTLAVIAAALMPTAALAGVGISAQANQGGSGRDTTSQRRPPVKTSSSDVMSSREFHFQREFELRQLIRNPAPANSAFSEAQTIAACIMRREGTGAAALVGGPMTDDPKFDALDNTLHRQNRICLRETAGSLPVMVSYALAEELVEAGDLGGAALHSAASDREASRFYMDGEERVSLDMVGRCLAAYSPDLAKAVLDTAAGSEAESERLEVLYEQTPQCGLHELPDEIAPVYQRGAVATGLYHWMSQAE